MKVWTPHSEKQQKAYFSDRKIIIVATGIQWGKTTVNAMRMKEAMHTYTSHKDNFIMTAPNYKILQQATLPEFLSIMEGWGEYSKADACFKMHNGGTCWMRTATNPDSVVGITNVRFVTGDEAGLFPLYFHENLQARASFKEAPIMYTTSPYSLNWLYKDYIRPIMKKGVMMPDVELIQARSDENPYFPQKEFERKKATMDPRRFNMIYGGEFNKVEGLVYDCFDEDKHVIDRFDLPTGSYVVAGVDWGFSHPAVILVIAILPDGNLYIIDEWYHTGKTIAEMVEAAEKLKYIHNIQRFYCDPSQPAHIEQFNRSKLTAIGADNSIRAGIDAGYEFIKSDKFHVFRGKAPNFLDEASMYHYELFDDYGPDKDVKERLPVMQNDHSMDAFRYVMYALKKTRIINKRSPTYESNQRTDEHDVHASTKRLLKNLDNKDYDW